MKSALIIAALLVYISTVTGDMVLRLPFTRTNSRTFHNRFGKRDTKEASLLNTSGKDYLVEVGVGTPPQYFNLVLDTGSADFWIPSTSCPVDMCPHTRFNNQSSTSFKPLSEILSIEYGIGFVNGIYGSDTVTIGSAVVPNKTIGLVSNAKNLLFQDDIHKSNGILGLAFPGLSRKPGTKPENIIMSLYKNKIISEPVFSVFLNSQFAHGNSGEVIMGGTDTTKYDTKDLHYAPVVSYDVSAYNVTPNLGTNSVKNGTNLYWSVPGQGVSTSTGYKSQSTSLRDYILDTGTTLTYVPADIAKSIFISITNNSTSLGFDTNNGAYRIDCNSGKNSNITAQFMISTSVSTVSTTPITINIPLYELIIPIDDALTPETSSSCIFGIAPIPTSYHITSEETWILGEATLRSIYSVYDLKEKRIGFAKILASAVTADNASTPTISNGGKTMTSTLPKDNKDSSSSTIAPSFWIALTFIAALFYL